MTLPRKAQIALSDTPFTTMSYLVVSDDHSCVVLIRFLIVIMNIDSNG